MSPGDADRRAAYVRRLFAVEDPLLDELRETIGREGLPEIYISPETGRMLQVLLAAAGARRVLEVGTLGGYSAIWMARSLPPDGRLITMEIDPARAALARGFVDRAGLGDRVEVRIGEATTLLAELGNEAAFDAIFIDADKERYGVYLDRALALVRPGGLILADNAFWHGRVLEPEPEMEGARAIQAFNRRLAGDPGLVSTIVPIGDGLAVAVRRP